MAAAAARWRALLAPYAPAGAVAAAGRSLIDRYAEPHRRYHTVAHLDAVVDGLFLDLAPEPVSVELAAFFHDAVYDPRAPGGANEADSAALAESVLSSLLVPAATVAEVARLVLTTVDHRVADADANAAVLNDADLAVLASPHAVYERYRAGVRAEYGWLDDASWRAGRAAVVTGLLGRPRLFATARGAARWEAAARGNLARELGTLTEHP